MAHCFQRAEIVFIFLNLLTFYFLVVTQMQQVFQGPVNILVTKRSALTTGKLVFIKKQNQTKMDNQGIHLNLYFKIGMA